MFAAAIALFALSSVAPRAVAMPSGSHARNIHRSVPAQFQEREYVQDADLLEDYAKYATRYQLFDCEDRHNTTFWDSCCHPLLKDESTDALPDLCYEEVPCDDDGPSTIATQAAPSSIYYKEQKKLSTRSIPVHHTRTSSQAPHTTSASEVPHTTTSSVVPHTTSSEAPHTTSVKHTSEEEPTTTAAPTTTERTSSAPQPTTTSSGGDGSNWVDGGFGTFYYQQGNFGACGDKHSDDDLIGAIDIDFYGDTGKVSPLCGKKVEIVNKDNGNTAIITIADVCPTCKNKESFDLSIGAFKALQPDLGVGLLNIKYRYV